MKITVLLFAGARELTGVDQLELDVAPEIVAADLLRQLGSGYPVLQPLLPVSRLAANGCYLADSATVDLHAELALIPPVSGG